MSRTKLDYKTPSPKTLDFMKYFDTHIIGQKRGKMAIIDLLIKYKLGLNNIVGKTSKPAGVLFFPGPSGVGKTWTVQTLANLLFDDVDAFTRIDCSEYKERHTISGLIGSPRGYIGYVDDKEKSGGTEPALSQKKIDRFGFIKTVPSETKKEINELKARQKVLLPQISKIQNNFLNQGFSSSEKEFLCLQNEEKKLVYEYNTNLSKLDAIEKKHKYIPGNYVSIVLFDEIEEAHPDVLGILLQILDNGSVTMTNGQKTDFRNCFIFMTSNIGSERVTGVLEERGIVGFRPSTVSNSDLNKLIYDITLEEIRKSPHFPTKLVGRIRKENIIVFRALTDDEIKQIIVSQLSRLKSVLSENKQIKVSFSQSLEDFIFQETRDKVNRAMGARPIAAIVDKKVFEPVVKLIDKAENGGIVAGNEIEVSVENDEVIIEKIEVSAAQNFFKKFTK